MIMATQMDLDQQDTAATLLREGARLLYTVAAGQYFELGDVNAWIERFNALASDLRTPDENPLGDGFGAIAQRTTEADPLVDQARAMLEELAQRATTARDEFAQSVEAAQQSGGGQ